MFSSSFVFAGFTHCFFSGYRRFRRPIHPLCMYVFIDLVFTVFSSGSGRFRRLIVQIMECTMLRLPEVIVNTTGRVFRFHRVHTSVLFLGIAAFADLSHKAWGAHFDRTSKESPCTKASKYHLHSICLGWRVGIVYTHSLGDRPRDRHDNLKLGYSI